MAHLLVDYPRGLESPLPTLLPSYNQIGFDSLHFLIGFVESNEDNVIAWVVEGKLDEAGNTVVMTGDGGGVFPFLMRYDDGLMTLENNNGVFVNVMSATIGFDAFRVATRISEDWGPENPVSSVVSASAKCGDIQLYGQFLAQMGLCNPDSDLLNAYGATLLRPHGTADQQPPVGLGQVTIGVVPGEAQLKARITDSQLLMEKHIFSILLVDTQSNTPVAISYGLETDRKANPNTGVIEEVSLNLAGSQSPLPARVRAYLMVDTYPAFMKEIDLP